MSARRPTARRLLPWRKRADHAGAGDALVHFEPEQAQCGRDDAGGAPLLEGQLGVRMQVAPQRDQVGQQVVDQLVVLQRHGRTVVGIDDAG